MEFAEKLCIYDVIELRLGFWVCDYSNLPVLPTVIPIQKIRKLINLV
jgi:hypothetical protein